MVNDHMMAILANRREALGLSALEVQAARRVSLSNYGNVGRKRPFGPTIARKRLDFQSWKSKRLSTIGHLGRPVELLAFLLSCLAFPLLLLSPFRRLALFLVYHHPTVPGRFSCIDKPLLFGAE